jgi:hypothetical protein
MMSAGWAYRCDFGHAWLVPEVREGEEPDPGGCPEAGHQPVTGRREPCADRLAFVVVPAARVIDSVRRTVTDDDRFYLTLVDRDGVELATSSRTLTLPEVTTRIAELSRANLAAALRKASRMGFVGTDSTGARS